MLLSSFFLARGVFDEVVKRVSSVSKEYIDLRNCNDDIVDRHCKPDKLISHQTSSFTEECMQFLFREYDAAPV